MTRLVAKKGIAEDWIYNPGLLVIHLEIHGDIVGRSDKAYAIHRAGITRCQPTPGVVAASTFIQVAPLLYHIDLVVVSNTTTPSKTPGAGEEPNEEEPMDILAIVLIMGIWIPWVPD